MSDVTVIVPVWNRRDLLESVLCGLRRQTQSIAEVLVVDDASQDGSAERAEQLGARAIRMGAQGGFAKAVNRGIHECRTPLIAIVNNDVELASDWLEKLAASLLPGVWFAAGKILQAGARDRIDGTYDVVCRGGTAWRVGNGHAEGPIFQVARSIWSAPMTAGLWRAELFARIGGLDERFESYLEDVDFGLRCALEGFAGRYVPEAVAWHQGSATLGRWNPATVQRLARNQVFLVAKHYSRAMLLRNAWHIAVAQGLWGLVALRHARGWSWLCGASEGIRRWSQVRSTMPESGEALPQVLLEGEREIRRLQPRSGGDLYWNWYLRLTSGGAK